MKHPRPLLHVSARSPERGHLVHWPEGRADRNPQVSVIDLDDGPIPEICTEPLVAIDSRDLLLSEVPLPTRRRRQAEKAVPYAIEEQLVADPESLHLTLGDRHGGAYPVAVIANELMEQLTDRLRRRDITPWAIVPDLLLLPWQAGDWTLMERDGVLMARTGYCRGFAIESDQGEHFLEAALRESRPASIQLLTAAPKTRGLLGNWLAGHPGILVQESAADDSLANQPGNPDDLPWALLGKAHAQAQRAPVVRFRRSAAPTPGPVLDLAWGPWRTEPRPATGRGRRVALLTAALATVTLIGAGVQWQQQRARLQQLRAQLQKTYLQVAPAGAPVIDAGRQLRELLAKTRAQQSRQPRLLGLLATLAAAMPGEGGPRLAELLWQQGKLRLTLESQNAGALQQLVRQLQQAGLQVETLQSTTDEGRVRRQLQITPPTG